MSADGKYTECCLNLNMNSSIEERRLTFEEMAPNWDKVYSALNNLISPLPPVFAILHYLIAWKRVAAPPQKINQTPSHNGPI